MILKHIDHDDILVAISPIAQSDASRRQREQHTVGELLTALLGDDVKLLHHPDGAPYLAHGPHISISHSRHYAAVALGPNPGFGIDIEEPRGAQLEKIAERIFSQKELKIFYPHHLLIGWTLKEAAFKAARLPIADLRLIDISRLPHITINELTLREVYSDFIPLSHPLALSVVARSKE